MFVSRGEIGPSCWVPPPRGLSSPPTIIPACRYWHLKKTLAAHKDSKRFTYYRLLSLMIQSAYLRFVFLIHHLFCFPSLNLYNLRIGGCDSPDFYEDRPRIFMKILINTGDIE